MVRTGTAVQPLEVRKGENNRKIYPGPKNGQDQHCCPTLRSPKRRKQHKSISTYFS